MAIDTPAKRYSALGSRFMRLPFGRRFAAPRPDGTIDQGDRQQLGFIYSGILSEPFTFPAAETLRRIRVDESLYRLEREDEQTSEPQYVLTDFNAEGDFLLFSVPDGFINRFDRGMYMTPPFAGAVTVQPQFEFRLPRVEYAEDEYRPEREDLEVQ